MTFLQKHPTPVDYQTHSPGVENTRLSGVPPSVLRTQKFVYQRVASAGRLAAGYLARCFQHLDQTWPVVSTPAVFAGAALLMTVCCIPARAVDAPPVTASEAGANIQMDNGTVALEISKARSQIISLRYKHEGQTTEMSRTMYYSASAGPTDRGAARPPAGSIQIGQNRPAHLAQSGPDVAEAVLENGPTSTYPFHTETHYVLPRGASGFYAYQIYAHPADQPAATIGEARFVLKGPPGTGLFTNHVADAARMAPYDTSPVVRQVSDATFLLQDGKIYTKYDNSAFMADHHVHGMTGHGVGVWMINASNEYVNGGPLKQELTVHADNTLLNMLQGAHFGSGVLNFKAGEPWTKFYGPFMVYFNSGASAEVMYKDALARVQAEQSQWPYRWAQNAEYPIGRGAVRGNLTLESGANAGNVANAFVILAAPGGDWPLQGKGYEFWTKTDANGAFVIPKVRPGAYTLYAVGGDQFEQFELPNVMVQADQTLSLGALRWKPVTHGRTLWQIGVADRSTQEFHDGENVRHFANFLRYGKDFPNDVTFVVGRSDPKTDWNYAQWSWYVKQPYWAIDFNLPAALTGKATLTFGIAASNPAQGGSSSLQIKVNGQEAGALHLTKSGPAMYRSGGQDSLYRVEYVTFDATLLKPGQNEITLALADARPLPSPEEQQQGRVGAIMYDAIRLEVDDKQEQPAAPAALRLPTLFIIGDSTVRNHTKGLMGWGDPITSHFDTSKINVVNRALGGRSSRTFLTEGLWDKTLAEMKAGDFVLMQFGHNDGGSLAASYRASIKGNGDETQEVTDAKTGKKKVVHTYGWYMRRYISDAKAKGATPIALSPVPRNIWKDPQTVARSSGDYGKWAQEAAKAENIPFIDLNDIIARHYEALGPDKVKAAYFPGDHTHTSPEGAELNAASVVEGLRALPRCPLTAYLKA